MVQALRGQFTRIINGIRRRTIGEKHVYAYYRCKSAFRNTGTIYFFPQCPWDFGYTIEKICADLALRITKTPSQTTKIAVLWEDATRTDPPSMTSLRVLNERCNDISKSKVELIFKSTFGYPLAIDPLVYVGRAVCKSEENAAHDGRVIDCPIASRDHGKVYERLIDNAIADDMLEDIRLFIVGRSIPLVLLKRRPKSKQFKDTINAVKRVLIDDVATQSEQKRIFEFADGMGLDIGEIDAMRDRQDGRLYLVDVNKTPTSGPSARMPFFSKIACVSVLSQAFKAQFLTNG